MNYQECLNYLAELGHEVGRRKFSLDATQKILASLGHPEQQYATAIVAGTNGKGSTSAFLASILERAGIRAGLYSSPHLVRVNERIQVNGREISDEDFAGSFSEVRQAIDRLLDGKSLEERPSFFEYLTAAAFLHFARSDVRLAVLEVGIGGRLDATNVTEPRVAVITNVDFDHVEILGSSIAAIAREKAGVIKPSRPVVSSCDQPEAVEIIRRRATELRAELLETPSFAQLSQVKDLRGRYSFDLALDGDHFADLSLPLQGRFQIKNAVAALAAAWRLNQEGFAIPRIAMVEGLRKTRWPGRMETVRERPLVLLDGAHNPAGAREVATFVKDELAGKHLRLVYASMRDKAIAEITRILFPLAEQVYLTRPSLARAASPDEILAAAPFRPEPCVVEPDPARAIERACQASHPEDVVLATGSLFLVGDIRRALLEGRLKMG